MRDLEEWLSSEPCVDKALDLDVCRTLVLEHAPSWIA
jgi:hypothetical protein